MCGIAGIAKLGGELIPGEFDALDRMSAALRHRGPDDDGARAEGGVALAHRRLSIIDVSPAGHQPMSNETGSIWVVYNGEIYNYRELRRELESAGHRFRSQSDTEVLVHGYEEWGEEGLLRRLRGMFAFALHDGPKRRVLLARDRLGIKPLYYSHDAETGRVVFASEVKALLAGDLEPGDVDREALAGFLLQGSVPAPLTLRRNVRCLLPGHYLVAENGTVQSRRYWDFPLQHSRGSEAPLGEVLRDAVARHLVSDVPLGIFLSGGVDSAGLVALARPAQACLKTLTISFAETEFDEAVEARRIARHFETEHHEIQVSAADFAREIPRVLAAMDQPTNDGVNTYFVAKAAREAGLTVVLSGLGGDELFWGYRHYHWLARNRRSLRLFAGAPGVVRKACIGAAVAAGRLSGRENWMRLGALRAAVDPEELYLAFRGFFPVEQMQRLMGVSDKETASYIAGHLARLRPPALNGAGTNANGVNYIEMKRYLHDQLLRDTDVFGMAHSIEVRVPYLDNDVVDLAMALPDHQKTRALMNKPLLVDAIGDPLVAEASRRRKLGFSFPLAQWMRQRAVSMREMAMSTDLLERKAVGKLWSAFERDRLHWSRAWSLVVLGARA
ncbi:MAG TPA: asparagine synthase (glutamine-hydrolyzing) [Bryobacteraceae bacterium]|nr:asparagine synthase (glutamine-hydrolyzing) [Bryobacteraceae bacterium]